MNTGIVSDAPTGSARRMYGDDPMDWARNMAACAAERALTRDWQEHPMFGIAVDKDKWAVGYQNAAAKLKEMVSAPKTKVRHDGPDQKP